MKKIFPWDHASCINTSLISYREISYKLLIKIAKTKFLKAIKMIELISYLFKIFKAIDIFTFRMGNPILKFKPNMFSFFKRVYLILNKIYSW